MYLNPIGGCCPKKAEMGLLLRCCSVPAEWAGNEEMHKERDNRPSKGLGTVGQAGSDIGIPCRQHLTIIFRKLKLFHYTKYWTSGEPIGREKSRISFIPYLIHVLPGIWITLNGQSRNLAEKAGVSLQELPKGDKHGCCGYGGHVSVLNHDFAVCSQEPQQIECKPYIACKTLP